MQSRTQPQLLLSVTGLALAMSLPIAAQAVQRTTQTTPQVVRVPERYVSVPMPTDELDSLATWTGADGKTWLIGSGKASHRLSVFDASTGRLLRQVGEPGVQPGQFRRPNGLAVSGNLLFVAERDNHRVQVLRLPDFTALGVFGADELRAPYGLWVERRPDTSMQVFVTDNFMYGQQHDVLPQWEELARRVHRFEVSMGTDNALQVRALGSFGDTSERNALRIVESIAGDQHHQRLLIADEATGDGRESTLRQYGTDGRFSGHSTPAGSFAAQAEGIGLWACSDTTGYWIASDQLRPRTRFHLFDRNNLRRIGSFEGDRVANTDGIALHAAALPGYPAGALFAVDDDQAVAAFDLADVVAALQLDKACLKQ